MPGTESEQLRRELLIDVEKWMLPPTTQERELALRLRRLPTKQVPLMPPDLIVRLGFKPHSCHYNCRDFVNNERSGRFRQVVGWRSSYGLLALHSIVASPEEDLCITPLTGTAETQKCIDFIADPDIQYAADLSTGFWLNGQRVPTGVRLYPEATARYMGEARRQLLSGDDPIAVIETIERSARAMQRTEN